MHLSYHLITYQLISRGIDKPSRFCHFLFYVWFLLSFFFFFLLFLQLRQLLFFFTHSGLSEKVFALKGKDLHFQKSLEANVFFSE